MPTLEQRSFAGGVISPALEGRKDLERYAAALKTCRNLYVNQQGSLCKRPGLQSVRQLRDRKHFLVPFVFSESQSYLLVFEEYQAGNPPIIPAETYPNAWVHVYANGARVPLNFDLPVWQDAPTTYAQNEVVKYNGHYYTSLQNGNSGHVPPGVNATDAWWENCDYVRLPHKYSYAQLQRMRFAQSGDVLTIAEVGKRPQQIKRVTHEAWTIGDAPLPMRSDYAPSNLTVATWDVEKTTDNYPPAIDWTWQVTAVVRYSDGTWIEQRGTPRVIVSKSVSLQPGITKPVVISWTPVPGVPAADVRYRVYRGRAGVFGLVGETDGTASQFTDEGLAPTWEETPLIPLEQKDDLLTAADKAPAAVAYFEQRLVYAGSTSQPTTVWMSRTGSFSTFGGSFPPLGEPLEADGKSLTLGAYQQEQIRALLPGRHLLALTTSSVWTIESEPRAVTKFLARNHARVGAGDLVPLQIGGAVLFVGKLNDAVYELVYSNETGGYEAHEISTLAAHLFAGKTLTDWTYQRRPDSVVWAVRSDGALLGLTYNPGAGILAWHHHDTDGTFENVECVPEGGRDVLYAVVRRRVINTPAYGAWDGGAVYATGNRVGYANMWWESLQNGNTAKTPGAAGSEGWWKLLDLPGTLTYCLEKMVTEEVSDLRTAIHLDASSVLRNGINADPTRKARVYAPGGDWVAGLRVQFSDFIASPPIVGDVIVLRMAARASRGPGDVALARGYVRLTVTAVVSDLNYDVALAAGDVTPFRDAAGSADAWNAWVTTWELAKATAYNPGAWPQNGLPRPPVIYADGTPIEAAANYAVNPASVVIVGQPFTTEAEFLDPPVPGAGNMVKKVGAFGLEYLGPGEPAIGFSLDSLVAEQLDAAPLTRPELARKVTRRNVPNAYALEARGALRQVNPYPLTVLGVLREVEIGGK